MKGMIIMSDNNKTGSGQSQSNGKHSDGSVPPKSIKAGLKKGKESCEFTHRPAAAQLPPPKPQDTKNTKKDK